MDPLQNELMVKKQLAQITTSLKNSKQGSMPEMMNAIRAQVMLLGGTNVKVEYDKEDPRKLTVSFQPNVPVNAVKVTFAVDVPLYE